MRNISFSMTTEAFRRKEKTVTRRLGWWFLKPGDLLQGCEKCQGLRKGEKVNKLHVIRVVSTIREPLYAVKHWGPDEMVREGLPGFALRRFIANFMAYNHCPCSEPVNRIEFEYVEQGGEAA